MRTMFRHVCSFVAGRTMQGLQCVRAQNFHRSRVLAVKMFLDRENKFAHSVLEQSLQPYQIFRLETEEEIKAKCGDIKETIDLVLHPEVGPKDSVTGAYVVKLLRTLVNHLQLVGNEITIADERFVPFTKLFCDTSHNLSDDELMEVLGLLAHLPNVESTKTKNYIQIWNALDIECCRRMANWSIDQQLKVCDAWYNLNLARITEFVKDVLFKLGHKVRKLSPTQLVQVMFLCNVTRSPLYEMFDCEENLAKCIEQISLKELGVLSMGFFKTKTPLKNPALIEHLYRRLIAEVDTVEDITLVAILKLLRYSTKLKQADLAMLLMEVLLPQVNRLSLLSCLHTALLGSDMQVCNDELLEIILQRFSRDIEKTRLKDLERICLVIGVFNSNSPSGIEMELCAKILPTIQTRFDEILKYPRCFLNCVHFLTLRGFYDKEILSAALEKRFIHHAYGKNAKLGREIFQLDSFVRINLRNESYDGNLLSDKMRQVMGKVLTYYIPERNSRFKLNLADSVLLDMKETTDRIVRSNTFKHVLPHFERPDIVFCYDRKRREALPLAETCPPDYNGAILTREELIGQRNMENIDTIVLTVAGWNNVVRGKNRHTGLFDMKLKQLQLLGHKPVVIYWYEWRSLETYTDRFNFLRRKLSTVINL